MKTETKKLEIHDVTLRDGFQKAGIAKQTVDLKLRITEELDLFGMDVIEAGWPGTHPSDTQFFKLMQGRSLRHAELAAFGSTAKIDVNPENDKNIQDLLESGAKRVSLVGKSSYWQVTEALGTTGPKNLDTVGKSIEFLKRNGLKVYFDAEHLFDGFKINPKYTLDVLMTAKEAGANGIILCDTNGGFMPQDIYRITKIIKRRLGNYPLGIHCHNDSETGVANTLEGIRGGAEFVQGTINGYGERVGNANLCSLLPNLVKKLGYDLNVNLKGLTALANFVASEAHLSLPEDAPFVGRLAFAHKGGLHVNAVGKNTSSYEHIMPEDVGNSRVIVNSEYGGKANIRETAKSYGFLLTEGDIQKLTKQMEEMGELGEAQNYLLIRRHLGLDDQFKVIERKVINSDYSIKAILRLAINGNEQLVAANGAGSLNAFDNALRKGVSPQFPEIEKIKLLEYKIVVPKIGETKKYGTDAQVKVSIKLSSNGDTWTTEARGDDMDKAAQNALTEGYIYWLSIKNLENQHSLNVDPS